MYSDSDSSSESFSSSSSSSDEEEEEEVSLATPQTTSLATTMDSLKDIFTFSHHPLECEEEEGEKSDSSRSEVALECDDNELEFLVRKYAPLDEDNTSRVSVEPLLRDWSETVIRLTQNES